MIKSMFRCLSSLILIFLFPFKAFGVLQVIAAENFYGGIAQQLGGDQVTVHSVLKNPEQDPHLFTADPSLAKKLSQADIIIYNGLGYDDWMEHLLSASGKPTRKILVVGELSKIKPGSNPHIWYNLAVINRYADDLTQAFIQLDPGHKADYQARHRDFIKQQKILEAEVTELHQKISGTPVIATEPVFGYMADALGLTMLGQDFQLSVMNETPPSPSAIKELMNLIKNKKVRILFYNQQTTDAVSENIKKLALNQSIPIIGITETQPSNTLYHSWIKEQLEQVKHALMP